MKKIKQSNYTNDNPPYLDKTWMYNQYNTILDRFKAMGWVAPSEQKGTTK
jgi:hypothetical protein